MCERPNSTPVARGRRAEHRRAPVESSLALCSKIYPTFLRIKIPLPSQTPPAVNNAMRAGCLTTVLQLLLAASVASLGEGIRTTQLRHHNDVNSTTKGTGHLIFQHKLSVPWVSVAPILRV